MGNKKFDNTFELIVLGLFILILFQIFIKGIIYDKFLILIWYSLICWSSYQLIWGNWGKIAYESDWNFFKNKMTLEEYIKSWRRFAIFFFIVCSIAFILGAYQYWWKE